MTEPCSKYQSNQTKCTEDYFIDCIDNWTRIGGQFQSKSEPGTNWTVASVLFINFFFFWKFEFSSAVWLCAESLMNFKLLSITILSSGWHVVANKFRFVLFAFSCCFCCSSATGRWSLGAVACKRPVPHLNVFTTSLGCRRCPRINPF